LSITKEELAVLERMLGFRVASHKDLFDFETPSSVKRAITSKRADVFLFRGTDRCMLEMPPHVSTRGRSVCCTGRAEVVDHVVPLSSNRLRKELRVAAEPGRKVPTQEIGSAHMSNLVGACKACNNRKLQSLNGPMIRRILQIDEEPLAPISRSA
jgi:5-methylcytosine-specific restriction endonuclease McrA